MFVSVRCRPNSRTAFLQSHWSIYIQIRFRSQTIQVTNGDCQIENSTVKLLNSLDATRASFAKPSAASSTSSPIHAASASASPDKRRKPSTVEHDEEYEKLRQLLTYDEVRHSLVAFRHPGSCELYDLLNMWFFACSNAQAPKHLQFNPFIRHGYRTYLTTKLCIESVFWWTNETVSVCFYYGSTSIKKCFLRKVVNFINIRREHSQPGSCWVYNLFDLHKDYAVGRISFGRL